MVNVYFKPTKNFLLNQFTGTTIHWTDYNSPYDPTYQTIALVLLNTSSSAQYDPITATRVNYTHEYVGGTYPNGNSTSILGGTFVGNSYCSMLEPTPGNLETSYYFGSYGTVGSSVSITYTGLTGTIGGAALVLTDTGNGSLDRTVMMCATVNRTFSSPGSMTLVIPAKILSIPLYY